MERTGVYVLMIIISVILIKHECSARTYKSYSQSVAFLLKQKLKLEPQNHRINIHHRTKRAVNDKPTVQSLHIFTNITSRYSKTQIESVMYNPSTSNKEAAFKILLPETAFISRFTMTIDGVEFVADVIAKDEAEEKYKEAKEQNKTAGLVGSQDPELNEDVRSMDKFKVSINVAANTNVYFVLTYFELLERRRSRYRQRISVRPNQIVDNLKIEVLIYEQQGIDQITVMEPGRTDNQLKQTEIRELSSDLSQILYRPSPTDQQAMTTGAFIGLHGDFVISYDVHHGYDAGLVQVEDNYFFHCFSPSSDNYLTPLNKNIIFVIDISGSMSSEGKSEQAKASMLVILDQLRPGDKFMILLFDDHLEHWPTLNPSLVEASQTNIISAKDYVREYIRARGGTDIHRALVSSASYLNLSEQYGSNIIVFLTDGHPTSGITSTKLILQNVASATNDKVSIFSLGFGTNLDFDVLQAISYRNGGFARRIYTGIDADVQLKDFFEEINTPLMYDVNLLYPSDQILKTSRTVFPQYFKGSEIVVSGKLRTVPVTFDVRVGGTRSVKVNLTKSVISRNTIKNPQLPAVDKIFENGFLEKLFIYMQIKDTLRNVFLTDNEEEKKCLKDLALRMALDYQLVTPLTSFLVIETTPFDEGTPGEGTDEESDVGLSAPPQQYPTHSVPPVATTVTIRTSTFVYATTTTRVPHYPWWTPASTMHTGSTTLPPNLGLCDSLEWYYFTSAPRTTTPNGDGNDKHPTAMRTSKPKSPNEIEIQEIEVIGHFGSVASKYSVNNFIRAYFILFLGSFCCIMGYLDLG